MNLALAAWPPGVLDMIGIWREVDVELWDNFDVERLMSGRSELGWVLISSLCLRDMHVEMERRHHQDIGALISTFGCAASLPTSRTFFERQVITFCIRFSEFDRRKDLV